MSLTSPTGLRAIVYVRISKDRKDETSTITQWELCQKFAEHKGWTLVLDKPLSDVGISAYADKKRPGLEKALRMLERKQADVLIVWKLDRLSRNLSRFHKLYERIEKAGAALAIVTHDIDTAGLLGQFFLTVLAMFAQMESELKRDRIIPFHDHRKANGLPPGGPTSYGYKRVSKSLVVIPEQAAVVQALTNEVIEGTSLSKLIQIAQQFPGAPVTIRGLKKLLLSPTIAGLRKHGETYTEGNWPAIVDRSSWELCSQILTDPKRRTSFNQGEIAHLLTGLIWCSTCNVRMYAKNSGKGLRYACPNCHRGIMAAIAENAVSAWLLMSLDDAAWASLRTQGRGHDPAVLANLNAERVKLAEWRVSTNAPFEAWLALDADIASKIEAAMNDEPLDLPEIDSLQKGWGPLTLTERRSVLTQIVSAVKIDAASQEQAPHERVKVERKS